MVVKGFARGGVSSCCVRARGPAGQRSPCYKSGRCCMTRHHSLVIDCLDCECNRAGRNFPKLTSTMKLAVAVLCLVAVAVADKSARIRNYQYGIEEDGSYVSEYETTNGILANEEGTSFPGDQPETGNYVRSGSYTYTWEGVTYTVNWTADENGFHPEGDHLPDFSFTREHIGDVSQHE